jgi:septal ring factor EnvC (AmiA/AmiB activator)
MDEAVLTSKARKQLPKSAFAIPPDRYPIHDLAHARNALARVSQHGSPDEQKRVRAAVCRRYPALCKRSKERQTQEGALDALIAEIDARENELAETVAARQAARARKDGPEFYRLLAKEEKLREARE